jgi:hypothetical protein
MLMLFSQIQSYFSYLGCGQSSCNNNNIMVYYITVYEIDNLILWMSSGTNLIIIMHVLVHAQS